jgi:hypothetical protein
MNQVVKLVNGKVVLALVGETSPILGLAFEPHIGVGDALNIRSNGTRIKVIDAPQAIYECATPQSTATSGTTTTHCDTTIESFANSDFIGGYLKLMSKGVISTNNDPLGTIYTITGYTAATGTFTFTNMQGGAASGAVTAGDIMFVFPPIAFAKGNLDANISNLVLTANAALPFRVANFDLVRNKIQLEASLHQLANKFS